MIFKNKLISLLIVLFLGSLLIVGCDGNSDLEQYTLTVSIAGEGVITSGGDIISNQTRYNEGTTVKLTALAYDGWEFNHWEGAGHTGSSDKTIEIKITSDTSITAVFTETSIFFTIYYPEGQTAPVRVEFDAPDVLDNNLIIGYIWDFDDGIQETTSSSSISHNFGTPGTYNVKLTVTDSVGNTDSFENNVNIY